MRVGLVLGDVADTAVEARLAEDLGFDYVAAGEHLFFHGAIGNGFVTLAAAAGATTRIGLVSSVTLLPLYPPALAAKLVSTLAVVSNGRFELGVGIGGEFPAEFDAVGVPVAERAERLEESLDIMRRLLPGGRISHDGRFGARLHDVELAPVPSVPPRIWMGGRKRGAVERAARHADVWMPYLVTPAVLGSSLAEVRGAAAAAGRRPESITGALFTWGAVGDDRRDAAVAHVSEVYRQDFAPYAERYLVLGSGERVTARLLEYGSAGADTVLLALAVERAARIAAIEALAEHVLPDLQH